MGKDPVSGVVGVLAMCYATMLCWMESYHVQHVLAIIRESTTTISQPAKHESMQLPSLLYANRTSTQGTLTTNRDADGTVQ